MTNDPRSPHAVYIWATRGLPRWEQIAFMVVNFPFQILAVITGFLLWLPFQLIIITKLPFMLFTMLGSFVWMICLAVILGLGCLTEKWTLLRPITFVLALPALVVGHFLNSVTPAPGQGDREAKILKWDLVESFPYSWSVARNKE
jgi:hypothetical protein